MSNLLLFRFNVRSVFYIEKMSLIGADNSLMVGMTVAVAIEEASK